MSVPTSSVLRLHAHVQGIAAALGGPILAFDTSVSPGCAAWVDADEVREVTLTPEKQPSEALAVLLKTWCEKARPRAIVVGVGPGSFTGVRVAVATAKGLVMGFSDVPVLGVSSLGLQAMSLGGGAWGVVLDARRGELFSAVYSHANHALLEDEIAGDTATIERLRHVVVDGVVTDGSLAAAAVATAQGHQPTPFAPRATALIHLAGERISRGEWDDAATLTPAYLREPIAALNLRS